MFLIKRYQAIFINPCQITHLKIFFYSFLCTAHKKMSRLTKLEREMKSILVMATKMEGKLIKKFKDSLTDLKIIKKK